MVWRWCFWLSFVAGLAAGEELRAEEEIPGLADYQIIDSYEELVRRVTKQVAPALEDLPQRLILFSSWYVASRTLWSALRGGSCACFKGPLESMPPKLRMRICEIDVEALQTVSPFLLGQEVSDLQSTSPLEIWSLVVKRALYLSEVSRIQDFHGDEDLEATMMSMAELAASELGTSWMTGRPPRILLPHCKSHDFVDAFWWEGVSGSSADVWLYDVLKKVEDATRVAAVLRPAPYYTLAEEKCDVSPEKPLLHDPSECLQASGWDVITMIGDLENVTSVGAVQGRITENPGNDTFRLEFDKEGKVTSRKYGKVILSPKQGGGITVSPKTSDLVVVSPQAGNCFEMADMIPPIRGNAWILVVPINPLYAPPTRIIPNYERIRFELHFIAEKMTDNHKLQRLLFLAHCSLQSTIDLLSPRYELLFVHAARAIFVERSMARHFCPGGCGSAEEIWHRGAGCVSSTLHLMKSEVDILAEAETLAEARWPCQDYMSLNLPMMDFDQLSKKLPSELRPFYQEPTCEPRRPSPEESDPASWVHVPGRQHALGDRGHCLLEEGFCECFPPWRGAECDQPEGGASGTVMVTMASRSRLHELHFVLANWWEKFNHRFDHPVLIFHQGLSPLQVAEIRQSSQNRVWFANVDRYFRTPQRPPSGPGPLIDSPESYRLMCRFKSTFVLDQPAMRSFDWMLWMDSDSYFIGEVEEDFASRMVKEQAIFGYTHVGREDAPVVKNLFDVALLFEAAELGGSKGRAPAAMAEDEGGVANHERAFEEGFSPTSQNTYFERILSVNSPLERSHVLPFSSPAWKGHVPLTDMMILHISSFRTDALRRFTDWIDEWGGWWLYRWGDAAIRAVQLWVMLEAKECYEFSSLPYVHQHFCRCGPEVNQECTFLSRGAKIFRWSCETCWAESRGLGGFRRRRRSKGFGVKKLGVELGLGSFP